MDNKIPTAKLYAEELEEDIEGIRAAIRNSFKDVPRIIRSLKDVKENCDKLLSAAGDGYLHENYDIEEPEKYDWSQYISDEEFSKLSDKFSEFIHASDDFDDYLSEISSISKTIDSMLESGEYYSLDIEQGVFDAEDTHHEI